MERRSASNPSSALGAASVFAHGATSRVSRSLRRGSALALAAFATIGCAVQEQKAAATSDSSSRRAERVAAAALATRGSTVPFRVPEESEIRDTTVLAAVRRGRAILANTRDSLPAHVGNKLRCVSCHMGDGLKANQMPLIGVYARFPQYRPRSAAVEIIEDRINDCFERSMNGKALPRDGRPMRDIVAYLAFLSYGIPVGAQVEGQGIPRLDPVPADTVRGRELFTATCTICHGADGQGTNAAPPLWGKHSYNIGAGMARVRTAAAFIHQAMPFDKPGTLTPQQAFDVAAYINSRPRPDFADKAEDWPNGDPPPDVAYPTKAAAAKGKARSPR
jgi:thiosulfate dehydrogenase